MTDPPSDWTKSGHLASTQDKPSSRRAASAPVLPVGPAAPSLTSPGPWGGSQWAAPSQPPMCNLCFRVCSPRTQVGLSLHCVSRMFTGWLVIMLPPWRTESMGSTLVSWEEPPIPKALCETDTPTLLLGVFPSHTPLPTNIASCLLLHNHS